MARQLIVLNMFFSIYQQKRKVWPD